MLKRISFFLLGIILVTLVLATVAGKLYGEDFVAEHVYGSVAFLVLWAVFSASALAYLLRRKILKNPPAMLLHFSFLLILAGAFVTRLFGEQGTLHVREGEETAGFVDRDGMSHGMPFTVRLDGFRIVYYAGTRAPMDFVSAVTVTGDDGAMEGEVAMNRILACRGYRFYQSGYDEDGSGVTLAVSHDPAGIAVTYSGYALLLLSMLLFFASRRSRFRQL
ncbi:MAG: cytochrome c biogenesis protein ResB, partial [Tannerella sp.]|nr:cytochrome c biogenesis protein ResB [Tannerella sp.]